MSPLRLARHVHICICGQQLVMLDLRTDRYMAFDAHEADGLASLVEGWPRVAGNSGSRPLSLSDESVVALINERIFTAEPDQGKPACPPIVCRASEELLPARSILQDWSLPRMPVKFQHRAAFVLAMARARIAFRAFTLEKLVRRVAERSSRMAEAGVALDSHRWIERMRELLAAYRWLRPWGYANNDRCLFDSLALIEYLAVFGVRVSWVFGVKPAPFAAHCWIQHGKYLLNDEVRWVRGYTPIMVI